MPYVQIQFDPKVVNFKKQLRHQILKQKIKNKKSVTIENFSFLFLHQEIFLINGPIAYSIDFSTTTATKNEKLGF